MTPNRKTILTAIALGGMTLSGVVVVHAAENEKSQAPASSGVGGLLKRFLGADGSQKPQPVQESQTPSPTNSQGPSDPTQPSPLLQEVLRGSGSTGQPKNQPQKIPNISLKAKVIVADRPAVAMLDIEGTYYTVQQDAELVFASPTSGTISMTVTKLDRNEIQIELTPLNQTLILR